MAELNKVSQRDKQAASRKHHHQHHHQSHWLVKTIAINYLRVLARIALLTLTLQCILATEVAASTSTIAPVAATSSGGGSRIKLSDGNSPQWAGRQLLTKSSASDKSRVGPGGPKALQALDRRSGPSLSSPAAAIRTPAVPRAGGELEAFSIDWTGLGDQEASDALKKMTRRRRADYTMATGWIPSLGKRQAKLYALRPIDELTAARRNSDLPIEPIFVSRRTEDLLENLAPQDSLDTLSDGGDKESFPLLGEFGSKISLLTTRKIEPNALFYRAPIGVAVDGSQAANWLPRRWVVAEQQVESGGDEHDSSSSSQFRLDGRQPEAVSIMESLGTNYLPRIARKSFM